MDRRDKIRKLHAVDAEVRDLQDHRDSELFRRVAAGDEDAFRDFYRRYSSVAAGLAYRVIGDQGLAEEVIQEVFLGVWRRAASYDAARGSVRSWLLAQVHHRAVDVVRREQAERRRAQQAPMDPATDELDDVVEEGWLAARRVRTQAALTSLPDEQRHVLELAYYGGRTQTQIADELGLPLGTVKSRTLAGMRKLREELAGSQL